jgi:hypothetical protein
MMCLLRHRMLAVLLGLQLIYALSGCPKSQHTQPGSLMPLPPPHNMAPSTIYYDHTVRWKNESLSIVAKWYTGSIDNRHLLAAANPHLSDPDLIRQGDVIHIPIDIMKTKEPLPEDFVKTNQPASSPKRSEKLTPPRPPPRLERPPPPAPPEPELPPLPAPVK